MRCDENGSHDLRMNLLYNNGTNRFEVLSIPTTGIKLEDGTGNGMKPEAVSDAVKISEEYTMLTGKREKCHNEALEQVFTFSDSTHKEVKMRVRLYNDGLAFRYEGYAEIPTRLAGELTTYRIPEGTKRWMQKFDISYENFYPLSVTGENDNRHWGYPALIQTEENIWALISEAGIERGHSASSLMNDIAVSDYKVCMAENSNLLSGEWSTPWRVVILGELSDVVESTLITDVCRHSDYNDTGWIRPGSVSWIYWAYNHGSKDYRIVKQYIDMAADLHLPYVLIDWEWDVMENGGTIEDALRYANERGVKTFLWYNSSTAWATDDASGPLFKLNSPENREKEFATLERNGVAGVKIDFFAGDTEETMTYCIDLLECAARHHLLVNFHGATIPRGWQRTYPNLMTVEAVYGAEWYNNLPVLTEMAASHNTTLPFTRNVIGPMDYTPCTFSDSQHPHTTTHAHELALSVVFESGLQHWADRPESYLSQPESVKSFMSKLPVTWTDTRLISGYPADHIVLARLKDNTWYVGGLNGTNGNKVLDIDWTFLEEGKYRVTLFEDNPMKTSPWKITTSETTPADLPREINCIARGGFVAVVEKI